MNEPDWIDAATDALEKTFWVCLAGSIAYLVVCMSGCASAPELEQKSGVVYERTLSIEIKDGPRGTGMLVSPARPRSEIRIKSVADLDFLLIRSCHRRYRFEPGKNEFSYVYEPAAGTQEADGSACPLQFDAVEKGKNRFVSGWIDFQGPMNTLPAVLTCNAASGAFPGVSACQAGAGQPQVIRFQVPVNAAVAPDACKASTRVTMLTPSSAEVRPGPGDCVVVFKQVAAERFHRLSTYGVSESLPEKHL